MGLCQSKEDELRNGTCTDMVCRFYLVHLMQAWHCKISKISLSRTAGFQVLLKVSMVELLTKLRREGTQTWPGQPGTIPLTMIPLSHQSQLLNRLRQENHLSSEFETSFGNIVKYYFIHKKRKKIPIYFFFCPF